MFASPHRGRLNFFAGMLLSLAVGLPEASAQVREVVVGITPTCPYGLSACWGGAHEALMRLDGVESVEKTPNVYNCTAIVRLKDDRLPDAEQWAEQFHAMVDQAYIFRGVEVTISGAIVAEGGGLYLEAVGQKQPLALAPLEHKLQWNFKKAAARGPELQERSAYEDLARRAMGDKPSIVEITGPLRRDEERFVLEVREFLEPGK